MDVGDVKSTAAFVGRVLLPVEIGLHRFGIEGCAVVKFDAGPQLEGPDLEIFRRFPGQCEFRLHLALVVEIDQRIENRRRRGFRRCIEDADFQRIEPGNIGLKADGDAAALLLGAGGACQQSNARCRNKKNLRKHARADCCLH